MKYCPNCGKQIKSGIAFCPYCGAKQTSNGTANQGATTAQNNASTSSQQDAYGYTNQNNGYMGQTQVQPILKKRITPPQRSFSDAFELFWKNYANFSGYSTRSEFWWWWLIELIIDFLVFIFMMSSTASAFMDGNFDESISSFFGSLGFMIIWYLVILIPNLSLRTRRFRDAGVSTGWTIALLIIDYVPSIIPFIGWFIVFVARIATLVIECMPSVRKVISRPQN